ncbi:putative disease resistance rpp13-like protein 1 [Fagus crenata]
MGSILLQSGIASASLQVLLDRLSNFALEELGLLFGVDDDIRKLERTLQRIQVLVDGIEGQHFISSNEAWQAWLLEVKSVSFDADDLLDKIDLELIRLDSDNESILGRPTQVSDIVFSSLKSLSIPHKLCEIQKKLDGMLDEVDRQFMIEIVKKKDPHTHSSSLVEEWDGSVQQEVLAGLRPHIRLKELQVKNYGGFMFPSWLSDPSLCKLVSISMTSCKKCKVLPPLGLLPTLKSLNIDQMHGLVSVDQGFCGLGMNLMVKGFPSLESLTFKDMPNLEVWTGLTAEDMPHLHQLSVEDCPKLICLPSIHFLSSLKNLEISQCPILQSLPDKGLPNSLEALIISDSAILEERCRPGGVDWRKIRAIPKIEIDYVEIPL